MFRHTYCAARLQTLDHGEPVSPFTVGKELGHGGNRASSSRSTGTSVGFVTEAEVVEYRIENHREVLADRLKTLGESTVPHNAR